MKKLIYIIILITAFSQAQIINSYTYVSEPSGELYEHADAADYQNEAATVKTVAEGFSRWSTSAGDMILEVAGVGQTDTTPAKNGDYSVKVSLGSVSTNRRIELAIANVEIGEDYTIKIWAKAGVGTNQIYNAYNFSIPITDIIGDWTEYTFNVTASLTGLATIKIYPDLFNPEIGDHLYIDNVSIVKTN